MKGYVSTFEGNCIIEKFTQLLLIESYLKKHRHILSGSEYINEICTILLKIVGYAPTKCSNEDYSGLQRFTMLLCML